MNKKYDYVIRHNNMITISIPGFQRILDEKRTEVRFTHTLSYTLVRGQIDKRPASKLGTYSKIVFYE